LTAGGIKLKLNIDFNSSDRSMTHPVARIALAALALTLVACTAGRLPTATEADAVRARDRWPQVTAAKLNEGRHVYLSHCGSCHRPVAPASVPAAEWPGHVREMGERAGLADGEMELVEHYLMTIASRDRGGPATAAN
jgi:cytochrome c5